MRQELLDYIYSKDRFQKKKLTTLLKNKRIEQDLDQFLLKYSHFMEKEKISFKELGNSYLQMVNDMLTSRLDFNRNGVYSRKNQADAINEVYNRPEVMTRYMLGLALSQFLWIQHYSLFSFYKSMLTHLELSKKKTFLEVGSGHGLFLLELLNIISDEVIVDVVDISETSLSISKKIVTELKPEKVTYLNFINSDINKFRKNFLYDFITIGEVIEHVEEPKKILISIS
ncbi:MAG: class I SAM-dependent methyltransferase, partial [Oligoflexia bacterium]|nr:class I SAM-dependent methyltransferase [Oligoflexia bacterium]